MRHRYPIPTVWLFTDERLGEALWPALQKLPRGAGVVVRHYGLPLAARRSLWRKVRRVARARGLLVLQAGGDRLGSGSAGHHGHSGRRCPGWHTLAVHNGGELARARQTRADAVFISPVFATRSHPGAAALGLRAAGRLARSATIPAIALGGMNDRRARLTEGQGFHGWAAIDAWTQDQKRNAVPT